LPLVEEEGCMLLLWHKNKGSKKLSYLQQLLYFQHGV